jgi:hypothetical protein
MKGASNFLCKPQDAATVCTDPLKSVCTAYSQCFDVARAFSTSTVDVPNLSTLHYLRFTRDGVSGMLPSHSLIVLLAGLFFARFFFFFFFFFG